MDYVFEWARDIYREDILDELRTLASGQNDCASMVHPDSDIYSTLSFTRSSTPIEDYGNAQSTYNQGVKAFQAMDNQRGIVRHATFIESHYRCFFVTRDNVTTMLQSTQDQATKILIRQIITQLQEDPLSVTWACLNMIEEQWTGRSRIPRSYHLDKTKFYASVTYASFLLPNWAQVWELMVIAVAHDAFESLVAASQYSRRRAISQPPPARSDCDIEVIKKLITKLRAGNTSHTLLAAIRRVCLRISHWGSPIHLVPSNAISRDIVHYIYNYFKKGQIEPQEPFLHVSSSFDQTHLSSSPEEPFHFGDLNVSADRCVLVHGHGHQHDAGNQMSSICVFFTDTSPDLPTKEMLGMVIKNTFENYDVYHTSRIHRAPNFRGLGKDKEGTRWNIEKLYGIFSEEFQFLDWVLFLGCLPPVRQGSSRNGTGASLFSRTHYPWHEPGYLWDIVFRIFVVYETVTLEVRYWRSIAKELRNQGIDCCEICSIELDKNTICHQCYLGILEQDDEEWFVRALLGKRPIEYRPINPELEDNGRERFWLEDDESRDLNAKFEKNLSFYGDIDEEFQDLRQLKSQTGKFYRTQREIECSGLSRKRKRSPATPPETE